MGTGTSSKSNEQENDEDVRNRLNSGDFQKISPPSSPSMEQKKDEMSYSGILVEKPGSENPSSPQSSPTVSASFAADLTTPPVSNRSKSRTKAASKDQPRRIVKATPPPSSDAVVDLDDNRNDNDSETPSVHHTPTLASPIGANAATEMLEESIEKNASKNKRLERVTNKQKNDRDKLLQEKRRRQKTNNEKKPQVQANPFSRFLSAFSVDTNPTHKRKDSADAGDPNKRLKYGFTESATKASDSSNSDNSNSDNSSSDETEDGEAALSVPVSWIVAASVATIGVLLIAVVRGSKKK